MQVHELSSACTIKKYACVKRIATYSRKYSHVLVRYKVTVYSNRLNIKLWGGGFQLIQVSSQKIKCKVHKIE